MARWFVDRLPQRGIPSVSLRRLLPEAQFVGCADWEVSGCCDDHRRLDPGQVFVAVRGARAGYDGHAFVRRGPRAGRGRRGGGAPLPDAGRLQVVVPDATAAHARICQALAGDPSHHLLTAGITGSFGRTITALLVRSILEAAGDRTGLLGALGFFDGTTARPLGAGLDGRVPAGRAKSGVGPAGVSASTRGGRTWRTRLDRPPALSRRSLAAWRRCCAELVDGGCKAGVLEASGEALAQSGFRGDRVPRRGGDGRRRAPEASPTRSSSNVDGPRRGCSGRSCPAAWRWSTPTTRTPRSWAASTSTRRRVAFAMEPASRPDLGADVSARIVRLDGAGTRMMLHGFDREIAVGLRLVGPRAAASPWRRRPWRGRWRSTASAVVHGLEPVATRRRPPRGGRRGPGFRRPDRRRGTPAALAEALAAVRAVGAGRVHCVLGAEGDGDRAERAGWPKPPKPAPTASSSPSATPAPRTPTGSSTTCWPASDGRARSASSPTADGPSRPRWPTPAPATPY